MRKSTRSTEAAKVLKSEKATHPKSSSEVHVWATSRYSLWDLSQGLRALRVSHSITGQKRTSKKVVNLKYPQPMPVHLTTQLDGYQEGAINFISAAVGALADTNFRPFPDPDLETSLRSILTSSTPLVPQVIKRDAGNYVDNLVRPSLLNKLQTEINRIQPYALRKDVQRWMLDYFNGRLSPRAVNRLLDRTSKMAEVKRLFKEGLALRAAVAELKTKPLEVVELETGFPSFELLYLTKAKRKD